MNEISHTRLNIEIENDLYKLVSLLKQSGYPKDEIESEIDKFKKEYEELLVGLDDNYVEIYLNRMYAKRNHGEILIQIKERDEENEL